MLMTFRQRMQYLDEVRRKNKDMKHPDGTYMAVTCNRATRAALDKWSTEHNIPNPVDPKDFHITIVYSRKGVPELADYEIELPLKTKIVEWKIFPAGDKKCLVGVVDSKELRQHHAKIHSQYDATYDYDEYIPHVTLSYDYGAAKPPTDLPDFDIVLDKKKVNPLDPQYTSKKSD